MGFVLSRVNRFLSLFIFLITSLAVLSSCSLVSTPIESPRIIKSDSDRKDYRYVELPNQLKVLLISDPKTEKAAASLDVHVGSGSDPKAFQGLAHFLEHMLFLGTEKYPVAGEYQEFISSHNGRHNAYTSFEHTNYFFDIDPIYLDQALDRFAQFFIAPLFSEEYVEREKNAVHSEYTSKLNNEQRRALDVFKQVISPEHPFAKFSVGNLQTLTVDNGQQSLRQQLLDFYQRYYSASMMTLVVMGDQPLSELEVMVRDKFSKIANTGKTPETVKEPLFSQKHHALPLRINMLPEQEKRRMEIAFPIEEVNPFYRQKPMQYLGNIIGHEGEGSLLSYLKAQGWVDGLSAGLGLSFRGGATYTISIALTEEGVAHIDDITDAVFQTINRIAETGDQPWLYKEQKNIAQQKFRYQTTSRPMNYVLGLASQLQYFPAEDVLRANYLMEDYDYPLIERFLSFLKPENSWITVIAPEVLVDQKTHFYQADYSVRPFSDEELERWKNVGVNPQILLPEPNVFVAENLELKPVDKEDQLTDSPKLLISDAGFKLWHKQDQRYRLPKGNVFFSLKTPLVNRSAIERAKLDIFSRMVSDKLNELSYPAMLAGLQYSIRSHSQGLSVRISGFDEKQEVLLKEILLAIKNTDVDQQRFDSILKSRIRQLENEIKAQPYPRAIADVSKMLYRNQWPDEQLLEAYKKLDSANFDQFQKQLLTTGEINVLIHGNYLSEEALALGELVRASLLEETKLAPALEVVKLNDGHLAYELESEHDDAAILLYLQAAEVNKKRQVALAVSSQMLRSDFYTVLRTEKQLGYVVTSGVYPLMDVPGIFFLVQSPVAGPEALKREIEQFIADQHVLLNKASQETFQKHRGVLIKSLSEVPKNLQEQTEEYWQDIHQFYFGFDYKEQLVAELETLTFEQWRTFFAEDVLAMHRAVWIYAKGKFSADKGIDVVKVADLLNFKVNQAFYRFAEQN